MSRVINSFCYENRAKVTVKRQQISSVKLCDVSVLAILNRGNRSQIYRNNKSIISRVFDVVFTVNIANHELELCCHVAALFVK